MNMQVVLCIIFNTENIIRRFRNSTHEVYTIIMSYFGIVFVEYVMECLVLWEVLLKYSVRNLAIVGSC